MLVVPLVTLVEVTVAVGRPVLVHLRWACAKLLGARIAITTHVHCAQPISKCLTTPAFITHSVPVAGAKRLVAGTAFRGSSRTSAGLAANPDGPSSVLLVDRDLDIRWHRASAVAVLRQGA